VEVVDTGCGDLRVAGEDRAPSVVESVRQHGRRVPPGEAVLVQAQVLDDGGRRGQRVEGTEEVVAEPGGGHLGAADGAAHLVVGLDDHDVPPGVGERVGGDQTVGPGADDARVGGLSGHGRERSTGAARRR
jgi:hypothetical protein